jgi:Flp pilus assembly protein protease CpaA
MEILSLIYGLYILLFLFGILTSFEDLRYGYISNKHIAMFSVLGLIINVFFIINFYESIFLLLYYFIIVFISLILGFLLYYFNFWSAGDGKLLITYFCLLPFYFILDTNINFVTFHVTILVNIFIPYFIYSLLIANFSTILHKNKKIESRDIFNFVDELLLIFVLRWITSLTFDKLSTNLGLWILNFEFLIILLISVFIIFVLNKLSQINFSKNTKNNLIISKKQERHFNKKRNNSLSYKLSRKILDFKLKDFVVLVLFIIGCYFQRMEILNFSFWFNFIVYYVLLGLLRKYMQNETIEFFTKKVHVLKLRRDMILRDFVVLEKGEEKISKSGRKSFYVEENGMKLKKNIDKNDKIAFSDKLSSGDIFLLNSLYKSNSLDFKEVEIQNMIPFAPLVFLGIIITILLEGGMIFLFF